MISIMSKVARTLAHAFGVALAGTVLHYGLHLLHAWLPVLPLP